MVIWVTGLSGAGKTTLCQALYNKLKPCLPELVLLDGDIIRTAFGNDLSHRESDRVIQVKRLQNMARVLSEQGLVVLVAVLYSHPELLAWNRQNIEEYFEIYIQASLELVQQRDVKGLYAGAAQGQITNVVGLDIPWYEPVEPNLVIKTNNTVAPELWAEDVVGAIPQLANRLRLT